MAGQTLQSLRHPSNGNFVGHCLVQIDTGDQKIGQLVAVDESGTVFVWDLGVILKSMQDNIENSASKLQPKQLGDKIPMNNVDEKLVLMSQMTLQPKVVVVTRSGFVLVLDFSNNPKISCSKTKVNGDQYRIISINTTHKLSILGVFMVNLLIIECIHQQFDVCQPSYLYQNYHAHAGHQTPFFRSKLKFS